MHIYSCVSLNSRDLHSIRPIPVAAMLKRQITLLVVPDGSDPCHEISLVEFLPGDTPIRILLREFARQTMVFV
jgi:hypothetical protein